MDPTTALSLVVAALLIEAAAGYPDRLFRAIGHPVTWIGALIAWLDRHLNREGDSEGRRRAGGIVALVFLILTALSAGAALSGLARGLLPPLAATLLLAILASSLIAQRSLHEHVAAVRDGLAREGLAGGRRAVSMIVGRNPEALDEAGVSRAAIESLAENFSDGIIAPVLYLAAGGLAGAAFYKTVNTADSMIGHRSPRHRAFGWAAARLDDLVNLPASRLSALLLIVAALGPGGYDAGGAVRAVRRDARHHRSPNAGWPEAAMAGALGLRIAGPRVYGTTRVEDGYMGDGRLEATADDIDRALRLYRRALGLMFALFALPLVMSLVF